MEITQGSMLKPMCSKLVFARASQWVLFVATDGDTGVHKGPPRIQLAYAWVCVIHLLCICASKYNQTILFEQRNIQRKGPTSVQKLL